MSGFLLDTNVVSELRKRERAAGPVRRWFDDHGDAEFWLSVLVVAELRRGIALVARRDTTAAAALTSWLSSVVDDFGDRILPVTPDIANRWAQINLSDPLPVIDGLLAATALEHGLTLVTRNVSGVGRTGVGVVDLCMTA